MWTIWKSALMIRWRSQSYTNGQLQEILPPSSLLVSFNLFWNGFCMVTLPVISLILRSKKLANNSQRDQSVKRSLAKDGHEDNDSSQQHVHLNEVPLSHICCPAGFEHSVHNTNGSKKLITEIKGLNRIFGRTTVR